VIENLIKRHLQPSVAQAFGLFCSKNPEIKKNASLPKEEMQSYESHVSDWDDLKPLGTDWRKPFLETAPSSSSF
jgi:hypothetical protein